MLKTVSVIALVAALATAAPPTARISPKVIQALQNGAKMDVMVSFKSKTTPILNKINTQSYATRGDRITALASDLQALSEASQKSVIDFLASEGKTVRSFWISNQIFVKDADLALVESLAAFKSVDSIVDNRIEIDPRPAPTPTIGSARRNEWGVETIQAPAAWDLGFNGNGVVVGSLDTGVRGTHESLRDNMRPVRGWFDTVAGSERPTDTGGHGTHVMGTIAGRNGLGVAPGAQWIACRAPLSGYDTYLECGQFFLCPTHANGTEPDCNAAPHVLSHSWGKHYATEEDFLDATVLAWSAAGILLTWSNGNNGPGCSTPGYPAHTNLPIITVGASDEFERLADFSSRGPGRFSGAGVLKPDITAPGVDVISASYLSDTGTTSMSGTSMASPHAAGVLALLLTNGTELTHSQATTLLYESAEHTIPDGGQNCGGIPETEYPNHAVGYGRISALGAVTRLMETRKH